MEQLTPASAIDGYQIVECVNIWESGALHRVIDRSTGAPALCVTVAAAPSFAVDAWRQAVESAYSRHVAVTCPTHIERRGDTYYLFFSLTGRRLLRDVLAANTGPMPAARALRFARALSNTLQTLETIGLSPAAVTVDDILVDASGNPIVLNAGLPPRGDSCGQAVRPLAAPESDPMAPDDPPALIYAVAQLLYAMLAGVAPAQMAWATQGADSRIRPPAIETLRDDLTPATAACVSAALRAQAWARPQTWSAWSEALSRALASGRKPEPVLAIVPPPDEMELRRRRRRWFLTVVGIVVAIAALIGIWQILLSGPDSGVNEPAAMATDSGTALTQEPTTDPTASVVAALPPSPTRVRLPTNTPVRLPTNTPRPTATPRVGAILPTATSTPLIVAPTETSTPTLASVSPTPSVPLLRVTADRANLRTGPGTVYPSVGGAALDDTYEILGRSRNGWYLIRLTETEEAWISTSVSALVPPTTDEMIDIVPTPAPPATEPPALPTATPTAPPAATQPPPPPTAAPTTPPQPTPTPP